MPHYAISLEHPVALIFGVSECHPLLIFAFHEIEEDEETRAAINDVVEFLREFGVFLIDWVLVWTTHFPIIFRPIIFRPIIFRPLRRIFSLLAPAFFGSFGAF